MPYQIETTRGWPYKKPKTYPTWIEAQRAMLRGRFAAGAHVVCTGIGKEG